MKKGQLAKYYAVITQGIFIIIVLLVGGYFLGRWIDKDSVWPAIFATIGAISGVIFTIRLVLTIGGDKDGRDS